MTVRHHLTIILATLPLAAYSQGEFRDTVNQHTDMPHSFQLELPASRQLQPGNLLPAYNPPAISGKLQYEPHHSSVNPLRLTMPTPSFSPGVARLYSWDGGQLSATGNITPFPGLMQIESGTIRIDQNIGKLSIHAGGIVNKYGFFRGLHTQYGITGNVSYNLTSRLSLTAFGTYCFGQPPHMSNGMPMSPAMMGYYRQTQFGASADYKVTDWFGVEAGAQAVQRIGTGRYEVEPIATPYIQTGRRKKVRIGLPVGQILYHIIKK